MTEGSHESHRCADEPTQAKSLQLPDPQTLSEALHQIFAVQEERALTYSLFDEGYQEYMQTGPDYNFGLYRSLVHHVTTIFSDLSLRVISLEAKLREPFARNDLADLVRTLQEKEKEKLELTAQFHIVGKEFMDTPDADDTRISALRKSIGSVSMEVNEILHQFRDEI